MGLISTTSMMSPYPRTKEPLLRRQPPTSMKFRTDMAFVRSLRALNSLSEPEWQVQDSPLIRITHNCTVAACAQPYLPLKAENPGSSSLHGCSECFVQNLALWLSTSGTFLQKAPVIYFPLMKGINDSSPWSSNSSPYFWACFCCLPAP